MASAAQAQTDQDLLFTLESPNPELTGNFGSAVVEVPDADGDGQSDLLVGAVAENGGAESSGRAYLFSGATGELLHTLESPNPQESGRFGTSVAGVEDADGDGRGDLLIGTEFEYETEDGRSSGRAYLFSGATGELLHTLTSANPQEEGNGRFGEAVAGIEDVDGDERGDLLVGASREGDGRAYLFSGATGELLRALESPDPGESADFGRSVAGVEDVDGDGRGDLLIAAPLSDPDRAYLFSGATGQLLHTLTPPGGLGFFFGFSVAGVPDADGDGLSDLLVGDAPFSSDELPSTGRAYLFSGATGEILASLDSPNPQAFGYFGLSVAGVEDVDGDGRGDLLVGADGGRDDFDGRAYLFSGATGALLYSLEGPSNPDGSRSAFGSAVAGVADVDGDGFGDLLIGAQGQDDGAPGAGRAYLFSGSTGAPPAQDTTPPECEIVSITPGPPTTLRVRTRDGGSGLASITVRQDKNATVTVPTFTPGVQTNVFVTAEKVDERRRSTVVLEVKDVAGNTTTCDPVVTTVSSEVPEAFDLAPNYPNPFNPTTRIAFKLAEASDLRLAVYDALGREVALLVSDQMEAGSYEVEWEGTDASGRVLPSGVYLYRMEAGSFSQSRTMTLVK